MTSRDPFRHEKLLPVYPILAVLENKATKAEKHKTRKPRSSGGETARKEKQRQSESDNVI